MTPSIAFRDKIDPPSAVLSLLYRISLPMLLQWIVEQSAELKTIRVNVERLDEYGQLAFEESDRDLMVQLLNDWPI